MNMDEMMIKKVNLRNRQRELNKQFEKEGLTEEVLIKQAEINSERHELDLVDEDELVFENFVQ